MHIYRYENGLLNKDKIFSRGFPDYLKTEEGLALIAEKRVAGNDYFSLNKFAIRVLLCKMASHHSFYELMLFALEYMNFEDAFIAVLRVKRGLVDTSQKGGYTKDQVYLKGYFELENIEKHQLKKLFIGKIGIDDLEYCSQLEIDYNTFKLPNWLE